MTVKVSDFTSTNPDITGWDIKRRTDVFLQFSHEALAETHYFSVCFSFRIEVRSTFTTTDRKTSQDVFEDLFETEEFQDPLVYSWVETKSASPAFLKVRV